MIKRTHTCGDLNKSNIGEQISLNGWISKRRDLGGLIFDLRDRYGITQKNGFNNILILSRCKKRIRL